MNTFGHEDDALEVVKRYKISSFNLWRMMGESDRMEGGEKVR